MERGIYMCMVMKKTQGERDVFSSRLAYCLVVPRGIWYMLCLSLLQVYIVHIVSG